MKVKFLPLNKEFEIKNNQSVLNLAQKNGIFIKSICNSLPSCSECRIKVLEGEHNIAPPSSKELQLIGSGYFIDQRRLSCQMFCFGDVVVDLSEQVQKQKALETPKQSHQWTKKNDKDPSLRMAISGNLIEEEQELLEEVEQKKSVKTEEKKSSKTSIF